MVMWLRYAFNTVEDTLRPQWHIIEGVVMTTTQPHALGTLASCQVILRKDRLWP